MQLCAGITTEKREKTLIPWMGGKKNIAHQIIELMPHHKSYCEVFFGGGAVLFNKQPNPGGAENINDINGDLINMYKVVRDHKDELIEQLSFFPFASREVFNLCRHGGAKNDIQRAANYLYVIKNSFGGRGKNYGYNVMTSPNFKAEWVGGMISQISERLKRTNIENLDYKSFIKRYDREQAFFYLDPPYFETEVYDFEFPKENYKNIADIMAGLKGKAMLSINKHDYIIEVFKDFEITEIKTRYDLARAAEKRRDFTELLIKNY